MINFSTQSFHWGMPTKNSFFFLFFLFFLFLVRAFHWFGFSNFKRTGRSPKDEILKFRKLTLYLIRYKETVATIGWFQAGILACDFSTFRPWKFPKSAFSKSKNCFQRDAPWISQQILKSLPGSKDKKLLNWFHVIRRLSHNLMYSILKQTDLIRFELL